MIRILKPGKENFAQCDHCGCFFAYKKEDTFSVYVFANENVKISQRYVKCPECGYDIWTDIKDTEEE